LQNQTIAGAAIDVYEEEPPKDLEFLSLLNLWPTSHIGGNSIETVEAMGHAAIGHLKSYFAGK
jgi:lactate dehydrogenase-like 2-hydroxyacid dehydrogenase